ncbi:uncharacterized protein PHALS_09572 [Plasmopara halstedii]|uniref:Lipocalin/cytosolic fatty-acid binding domain-containing protein n=1 Tax=Plasmopara halstedii TaxID=4781 RepID=A0A0N7L3C0_PLAHL|nr:uncharacterized protein PHALS_09572 [Plasmopara halstedii]CEG35451.1 hypothetical protein PHALS_09572 [Plasmopara halstedii]|eukprot:XP_024571820.1 hypothetical protein PHALS_09572 [Plasmopara halstedii]
MVETTPSLLGTWLSTEAFGNTALDWSEAVKKQRVQLQLTFKTSNTYKLCLVSKDAKKDVTSSFRHVMAKEGRYDLQGIDKISIYGDDSGIEWTYLFEEENNLRIRLEGAKRVGRCKGVDVIYLTRAKSTQEN